jgi:hypothetical protein
LDIGVNKNRDSPYNMACLPGGNYSETNLGSIYLVPVHTHITTQDDFKKLHVSAYNKKKELIDAGDYEKGKHRHPEERKKQVPAQRKKQVPALRKEQVPAQRNDQHPAQRQKHVPALRKVQGPAQRKHQHPAQRKKQVPAQRKTQVPTLRKVQDPAQRKKTDQTGWSRSIRGQSDAKLQQEVQERFTKLGGVGIVSPQKAVNHCGNTTTFFSKDESAGVKGVNNAKCKWWKALPCHGHHRQ